MAFFSFFLFFFNTVRLKIRIRNDISSPGGVASLPEKEEEEEEIFNQFSIPSKLGKKSSVFLVLPTD